MDIERMKSEKAKLEYSLIEEQFHYDSIPIRKEQSQNKALLAMLCAIPATLIAIASIVFIIDFINKPDREKLEVGIGLLVSFVMGIVCIIISIYMWREWHKEFSKLHGIKSKWSNFDAKDYKEEEIVSKEKIVSLTDNIKELEAKIAAKRKADTLIHFELADNSEPDFEDPFFLYAYGTWGDDKETLLANMKYGKYEKEKTSLLMQIDEQKQLLKNISNAKITIDNNYEIIKDKIIFFILGLSIIVFIQIAFLGTDAVSIGIKLAGMIYGLVGILYLGIVCQKPFLAYKVEHKYNKYRNYAEHNGIKTTAMQMKTVMQKIDTLNNRLEYVEEIIKYKDSAKL